MHSNDCVKCALQNCAPIGAAVNWYFHQQVWRATNAHAFPQFEEKDELIYILTSSQSAKAALPCRSKIQYAYNNKHVCTHVHTK